jgi:hypothetical protein
VLKLTLLALLLQLTICSLVACEFKDSTKQFDEILICSNHKRLERYCHDWPSSNGRPSCEKWCDEDAPNFSCRVGGVLNNTCREWCAKMFLGVKSRKSICPRGLTFNGKTFYYDDLK